MKLKEGELGFILTLFGIKSTELIYQFLMFGFFEGFYNLYSSLSFPMVPLFHPLG